MRARPTLLLLIAGIAVAGCGDDSNDSADSDSIPGGADPVAVEVIDGWANDLRAGEVEAAADRWGLPSVAQNGTPPLELDSREDVIAFNESLPCGAELTRAETEGEFTIATFELTERPGPGECGAGTGETAMTAFVIEDGKIVEWRRAADDPVLAPPTEGPVV